MLISRRKLLKVAAPALISLGAPRLIRPGLAASHGVGAATPPIFQSLGLTNGCLFYENFRSAGTIDSGGTGAPGFNWFLSNAWPGAAQGGGWNGIQTAPATNPSYVSVANSVLSMTNSPPFLGTPGSITIAMGIHTAQYSALSPGGYVGRGFTPPFGVQFRMRWDPSFNSTTTWPIAWGVPLPYLTGAASRFTEIDFIEYYGGAFLQSVHDWQQPSGTNTALNNNIPANITDGLYHDFSTYYYTVASGGGTGGVKRYVDGVHLPTCDVTWTAGQAGSFSDNHAFMVILDCGTNSPVSWQYFGVWH